MPSVRVDGNDPIAMYNAAKEAIDRARAGGGPTLIEAMTFRFYGHVFGDDDSYMDSAEKQAAMAADPYPRYREWLVTEGHATEVELSAIDDEHIAAIDAAVKAALAAPWPDESELRKDVFATEMPA